MPLNMFGRPFLLCIILALVYYLPLNMGFSKFLDKLKGNDQPPQTTPHPGGQSQAMYQPQMQQPHHQQQQMQQSYQPTQGKRMVGYFVSRL